MILLPTDTQRNCANKKKFESRELKKQRDEVKGYNNELNL